MGLIINIVLLISSVWAGAAYPLLSKKLSSGVLKSLLAFGGAYLLCVSIVHLIPELFTEIGLDHEGAFEKSKVILVSIFLVLGFLMQKLLESWSSGVEHGHVHHEQNLNPMLVLISLFIHSLLEGTILVHPEMGHHHDHHSTTSLLAGIILHKIPAGFAMAAILVNSTTLRKSLIYITIFCLGSPIGLLLSNYLTHFHELPEFFYIAMFALVTGSFLHISTTIFFESSSGHRLNARKWFFILAGATLAILSELF